MKFTFDSDNKEQKLFIARLDDHASEREKGRVSHSDFLTPSESFAAEKYLSSLGIKDKICFFGGYFAAERKQIFLLPDYVSDYLPKTESERYEMLCEEFEGSISALEIKGSSYKKLTHRDYLGSVLALGIKRSAIGDICMLGDSSAIIFCLASVEGLILTELQKIGADKVSIKKIKPDVNMPSCLKFKQVSDTVASNRIDCIVSALCTLSREKAQETIRAGLCTHNYSECEKTDLDVNENDVISVRGHGKFIIRSLSGTTKKGRIRLIADKYE